MNSKTRSLKIEAVGDFSYRKIKPRIRLSGQWLEKAGFKPGNRVSVQCVAEGVMELRSNDTYTFMLNETSGIKNL